MSSAGDVGRGAGVLGPRADVAGDRLDLGGHVAGEEAGVRTRVGERLVLLVEALRGGERAAGGEAEARVRVALERGQVVEERRLLLLRRLLELGDRAGLAAHRGDDRLGLLRGLQPRLRAGVEAAGVAAPGVAAGRLEGRVDEPVRLGLEGPDLLLAPGDQRQRRRLHAAQRDRAVERGAQPDRRRARGVHADDPVRLGARARRLLEPRVVVARVQVAQRLADRGRGHRLEPEAVDGLLRPRLLERPGEDQLALAAGVAGVDDPVDVRALEQLGDHAHLLLGALVADHELEVVGHDRQVRHAPLLVLGVVLVRLGELDEVADRPGHDVVVRLEVALELLERAGQDARQVAADGRLLGDDEGLPHGRRSVAGLSAVPPIIRGTALGQPPQGPVDTGPPSPSSARRTTAFGTP